MLALLVSFRPLAGLSCINLIMTAPARFVEVQFPSPRGVELHKPIAKWEPRLMRCWFPSPRGVELHKPRRNDNNSNCAGRVSVASRG